MVHYIECPFKRVFFDVFTFYSNVVILITRTISLDLRFAHGRSMVALRPAICNNKVVKSYFLYIKKVYIQLVDANRCSRVKFRMQY